MFSPTQGEMFWLRFLVFFFDLVYCWIPWVKLRGTLRSTGALFGFYETEGSAPDHGNADMIGWGCRSTGAQSPVRAAGSW